MTRLNLNLAYNDKDMAKHLGARWNPSIKRWWAPKGSLVAEVLRRNIVGDDVILGPERAGTVANHVAAWAGKAMYKQVFGDADVRHCNLSPSDIKFLTSSRHASSKAHWGSGVSSAPTEPHYYLTVHYADKALVKSLGAKWDAEANRWYATKDSEIAAYHRLMDRGIPHTVVDGDPLVTARIYNMTARGVWTRTFGPSEGEDQTGDQAGDQSQSKTEGKAA